MRAGGSIVARHAHSALLSLALAVGGVGTVVVGTQSPASASAWDCKSTAYACTPNYTGNNASGTWGWKYYGGGTAATPTGTHNCTLYVAWRLAKNGMGDPGRAWGDATEWKKNIGGGNHTPAVGSIAWWGSGHVAYVEQVDGDRVFIRADSWVKKGGYTSSGWIAASSVDAFLHPHDLKLKIDPTGDLTGAGSHGDGELRVKGWAFDMSHPKRVIDIAVYVGKSKNKDSSRRVAVFSTHVPKKSIQDRFNKTDPHLKTGFDKTLRGLNSGWRWVFVFARDVGPGETVEIGRKHVKIQFKKETAPDERGGAEPSGGGSSDEGSGDEPVGASEDEVIVEDSGGSTSGGSTSGGTSSGGTPSGGTPSGSAPAATAAPTAPPTQAPPAAPTLVGSYKVGRVTTNDGTGGGCAQHTWYKVQWAFDWHGQSPGKVQIYELGDDKSTVVATGQSYTGDYTGETCLPKGRNIWVQIVASHASYPSIKTAVVSGRRYCPGYPKTEPSCVP